MKKSNQDILFELWIKRGKPKRGVKIREIQESPDN